MNRSSDDRNPTPETPLRLGAVVRAHREALSWSIHRLAREAGVSPAAVHKIERGQMVPTVRVLLKVAQGLRQPVAALLAEDDAAAEPPFAVQRAERLGPDTEKRYIVLSGAVAFELDGRTVELGRGDALNVIRGSVVKSWTNIGDAPCELLCVATPPLHPDVPPSTRAR